MLQSSFLCAGTLRPTLFCGVPLLTSLSLPCLACLPYAAGALRPTLFCGVPRVFDRIYAGVMSKVSIKAASTGHCNASLKPASRGTQQQKHQRT